MPFPHQQPSNRFEHEARIELLRAFRDLAWRGLNPGTAGNASLRVGEGFLVTPSGMPADEVGEADLVLIHEDGSVRGVRQPSSEWRLHRDILRARPEVNAVFHAHSPCATALACHAHPIPPFHYMVLRFGGPDVRCAPYATYGTQALSDAVVEALVDRTACLMSNHGMVVIGKEADRALAAAVEFESLCDHYWRALQLGAPRLLTAEQLEEVQAQFESYGQPDSRKNS